MKQNWDVCVRCLYLIYGHTKSPFYKSSPKELRIRVVLLYRGGVGKDFLVAEYTHIYMKLTSRGQKIKAFAVSSFNAKCKW